MKRSKFVITLSVLLIAALGWNCSSSKEGSISESANNNKDSLNLEKTQIKNSVTKAPRLFVEKEKFIFSDAEEGTYVNHEWELKNIGTDTLYITDVESSCGCTAVSPSKKVIGPDESTKLKIIFDTRGRLGINTKFVTIHSNDSAFPNKVLVIEGRVVPKKVN